VNWGDLTLLTVLTFPVAVVLVRLHELFVDEWQLARVEKVEAFLKPLRYSDRHRELLPFVEGMATELCVRSVVYERQGSKISVEYEVAWWGRSPWNRARLMRKAKALLRQGGVTVEE